MYNIIYFFVQAKHSCFANNIFSYFTIFSIQNDNLNTLVKKIKILYIFWRFLLLHLNVWNKSLHWLFYISKIIICLICEILEHDSVTPSVRVLTEWRLSQLCPVEGSGDILSLYYLSRCLSQTVSHPSHLYHAALHSSDLLPQPLYSSHSPLQSSAL